MVADVGKDYGFQGFQKNEKAGGGAHIHSDNILETSAQTQV